MNPLDSFEKELPAHKEFLSVYRSNAIEHTESLSEIKSVPPLFPCSCVYFDVPKLRKKKLTLLLGQIIKQGILILKSTISVFLILSKKELNLN